MEYYPEKKEIIFDKKIMNELDRFTLDFIKFWTNYMKKTSDEKWSQEQANLIDSQIKNSRNFQDK